MEANEIEVSLTFKQRENMLLVKARRRGNLDSRTHPYFPSDDFWLQLHWDTSFLKLPFIEQYRPGALPKALHT